MDLTGLMEIGLACLMDCPRFYALALAAFALDALFGDPVYPWHPVRIMGKGIACSEKLLRRAGWDGYAGGIWLFLILASAALGLYLALHGILNSLPGQPAWLGVSAGAWILDLFLAYSLFALRDLWTHASRVEKAAARGDLDKARQAASMLVGRDTQSMDAAACRRAAVESLAENLTDGIIAPLFWLLCAGLPGLLLFKIASTMDSMVGYRSQAYLRFGWFGARLDDVLCWVPARLTFVLLVIAAALLPGYSARKAWRMGIGQHQLLPGPNPGWSECAAAGALQIRLIGPLWKGGVKVTDLWIGDAKDREGGNEGDIRSMARLALAATVILLAGSGIALGLTLHFKA